jgi:hypothetical protein
MDITARFSNSFVDCFCVLPDGPSGLGKRLPCVQRYRTIDAIRSQSGVVVAPALVSSCAFRRFDVSLTLLRKPFVGPDVHAHSAQQV